MRTLWADDVASFSGEFVRFEAIRVNPKPVRDRRIPVVIGGNSDAALQRGAGPGELMVAVALTDGSPAALTELAQAGVTEVVVVDSPPPSPDDAGAWVENLAARWIAGPG